MNGNQDDNFYSALKHCIEELGRDGAGPWWEGDLQFQLGRCLMCSPNGASELMELKPPPTFLGAWPPPIMTRRLRALNYAAKQFPDFTYWPPNTNKCWAVELKLWSLEGGLRLNNQLTGCMTGLEKDAKKVLEMLQRPDGYCGGLVLSVVNIPNTFAVPKTQNPYSPDDFKKKLIERIDVSRASGPLHNLVAGGGHWCVAIKKINGAKVEEFEVYTSLPNFPDLFHKG